MLPTHKHLLCVQSQQATLGHFVHNYKKDAHQRVPVQAVQHTMCHVYQHQYRQAVQGFQLEELAV